MMSFLKTILIILLVYFGAKFLIKLLTPYLMRYIAKKANQKFGEAFGQYANPSSDKKKEGSVTIDKMPPQNSQSKNSVGEYVDYEDVD